MNQIKNYNFIVADDHSVVTQGMSFILKDLYKGATVYQIENFFEIIKVLNTTEIDLLILDINFPEGSSLNLIPTLKKIQPNLKILIFSGYDEEIYAIRYLNAGANGYLKKLSSEEEIKHAIKTVMTSGKYTSKNIQDRIMDSYILKKPTNPLEQLSNREIEIAKFLVDGHSNIDISKSLSIKKTTVSTYKNRIFEKLSIDTLSGLIQIFQLIIPKIKNEKENFINPYLNENIQTSVIDVEKKNAVVSVFKYFKFPLFEIDKMEMLKIAKQNEWLPIMNLSWFCHKSKKDKPCGKCNPCKTTIMKGLAFRIPLMNRLKGYIKIYITSKFN